MLRTTHFQLARHMHPSEMHPLLDFWLHPQNGWQVDARYAYCTNDKWHAIASHTIWCHIIGRAHLCIFIITAIAVPVTQLSAVTTQTSNDLWLMYACTRVIQVMTCINEVSAMSAWIWYTLVGVVQRHFLYIYIIHIFVWTVCKCTACYIRMYCNALLILQNVYTTMS